MTIQLKKGQKINLSKEKKGLSNINVALGWDAAQEEPIGCLASLFMISANTVDFDCDASAFMLVDGKLDSDKDLIYYGNLKHISGGVNHSGDNLTGAGVGDDEVINVNISSLPKRYDSIVFTVTIYKASDRKQHFGMIKNAYIRIVDLSNNVEICKYNLTDNYDGRTAMIFGKLTKTGDEWNFEAIGEGTYDDGVNELARRFK